MKRSAQFINKEKGENFNQTFRSNHGLGIDARIISLFIPGTV